MLTHPRVAHCIHNTAVTHCYWPEHLPVVFNMAHVLFFPYKANINRRSPEWRPRSPPALERGQLHSLIEAASLQAR